MEEVLLCNSPLWTKQWEKRDFFHDEVDENGEFQIVHVMFTCISHPIADEISQQVCALKVLAVSVGKGHDSLIYIYEEYNSVS